MESMEQACSLLVDCAGVLIEGNSILTYIDPDLAFFVYGGVQTLKPSRLYALQKAGVIINNLRDESAEIAAIEKLSAASIHRLLLYRATSLTGKASFRF